MSATQVSCRFGDSDIIIETGKLAKQAGGAVTIRSGDTIILVTATAASTPKEGIDFLPLTVEYLEKTFAAGKIPGGFFKREGRPSEAAILTSRFIDRPIRPLFPEHYHFETQVIATVLSASPEHVPDVLAITAASAALSISDIPLVKPIAGCRVGRINGQFKLNPTLSDMSLSDMEIVVAASEDAVVMVEGGCVEVSEVDLVKAIQFAHESLKPLIAIQKELQAKVGKTKRVIEAPARDGSITQAVEATRDEVKKALAIESKLERYARLDEIKTAIKAKVITEDSDKNLALQLAADFSELKSSLMRGGIIKDKKRIDRRGLKDIRKISCEVGLLPRSHGSALFTRGETQALVAVTLGSSDDEQTIDALLEERSKAFMLNYNFPAFSVGEVKPLRSPGRREIGHGHLAERSLHVMAPKNADFPYTIRIVSEILESNGSSSMASVCGGSLALMDAGVPVKAPVAGIAMGLIMEGSQYAILSDILGDEDHLGDMDFKVTGTDKGVTALQMDIKIEGITPQIMAEALEQAREGRQHILKCMAEAMSAPRAELSQYAPKIVSMKIKVDKIRDVIGSGGKNIRGIIDETGVKIDIEDDGTVKIFSSDQKAIDHAIELVKRYTDEVEVGKLYTGVVKKIMDFGAFVEVLPKTDGLVHVSQIANHRVEHVADILREGDTVTVRVLEVDSMGKIRLTMKNIDQPHELGDKLQAKG
jgi:polyribonucleotide nucleotidyltransferase